MIDLGIFSYKAYRRYRSTNEIKVEHIRDYLKSVIKSGITKNNNVGLLKP